MRRPGPCAVALLVAACGEPTPSSPQPPATAAPIAPLDVGPVGDAVLAQARTSIDHGVLADASRTAILASSSPAHARARALLEVLVDTPPAAIPTVAVAPTAMPESPPLAVPPAEPPAESTPPAVTPASTPTPKSKPTLEKLAMKSTKRGASLSIHTGRGVLVGVANQPEAGVVRLVLEDVAAAAKVLGARPSVTGARVKDVSAGPKSVRITLQLDDGWRFGGVSRTGSGARVDLIAP